MATLRLAVGLAALAAAAAAPGAAQCDALGPRKDCGYIGIDRAACVGKGCCWAPLSGAQFDDDAHGGPRLDLATCFHANTAAPEYDVVKPLAVREGEVGADSTTPSSRTPPFLRPGDPLPSTAATATLALTTGVQPELGPDFGVVSLGVDDAGHGPGVLRVRLTDGGRGARWEVPPSLLAETAGGAGDDASSSSSSSSSTPPPPKLTFALRENPLSFEITRAATADAPAATLFNTTGLRLVLKDQYLELTTWLPESSAVVGLGERISSTGLRLKRSGRPLTLWNRDCTDYPDLNLYGSFPFYMELREDGTAHGILLWNSNAMDVVPRRDRLSFRATGGVLDVYVLAGPTPLAVVDQVTRLVGRPAHPPLWALGFHQSKYGYASVAELAAVAANYSAAAIPLDVLWGDIDYMSGWRDFTFDETAWPEKGVRALVDRLHADGRRFVPILDPGIKLEPGYAPYDDGVAAGVFVRDVTGAPYIGEVWPGAVHFVDFMHPGALDYWHKHVAEFHAKVPFDGLWIDMNEASNFCTGHVCEVPPEGVRLGYLSPGTGAKPYFEFGLEPPKCALQCWSLEPFLKQWLLQEQMGERRDNATTAPPPSTTTTTGSALGTLVKTVTGAASAGARAWQEPGFSKAEWEAFLKADSPPYHVANNNVRLPLSFRTLPVTARHAGGVLEYDAHNLYGLAQASVTAAALRRVAPATRPFVLTRSSFMGAGAHAAHWLGDNAATWDDLRWSVSGVLEAGLYGNPLPGADVCGFLYNTTAELCARWIGVGAFHPFVRDHSDLLAGKQELYRWPETVHAARAALGARYRLLPYFYSGTAAATAAGCPLARPLFFGWPADAAAVAADEQWLVGDGLLVSPAMRPGVDTVDGAYFPPGAWYDWWNGTVVVGGTTASLPAPLGHVPLHLSGGLALLTADRGPHVTTGAAWRAPLGLTAALPARGDPVGGTGQRCGPPGPAPASPDAPAGARVAWGRSFRDSGDDADPAAGGWLAFSVWEDAAGGGGAALHFTRRGAWRGGGCGATRWPRLESVRVLGLATAPDAGSVTVTVAGGKKTRARSKHVAFDAGRGEMVISGLKAPLECKDNGDGGGDAPTVVAVAWRGVDRGEL